MGAELLQPLPQTYFHVELNHHSFAPRFMVKIRNLITSAFLHFRSPLTQIIQMMNNFLLEGKSLSQEAIRNQERETQVGSNKTHKWETHNTSEI